MLYGQGTELIKNQLGYNLFDWVIDIECKVMLLKIHVSLHLWLFTNHTYIYSLGHEMKDISNTTHHHVYSHDPFTLY